jgi:hypothetical protein
MLHGTGIKNTKTKTKKIAVLDCETDPFGFSSRGVFCRNIQPFAWGLYDGIAYKEFWGIDSTERLLDYLRDGVAEPLQIFAHNGGRFDFMFMLQHLRGKPLVINRRIVDAELFHHTVSDSYARLPVPLSRFENKREIEYWKMEPEFRNIHSKEIRTYLKQDCVGLYDVLITGFDTFGRKWTTMASASFRMGNDAMKAGSPVFPNGKTFYKLSEREDAALRPYYYGGRVQLFKQGVIEKPISAFDANSMYPSAMILFKHPVGGLQHLKFGKELTETTDFADVECWSKGALPIVTRNGLQFPVGFGRFKASGHELRMGIETGRLKIHKVFKSIDCQLKIDFKPFVLPLYRERLVWKERRKLHKSGLEHWPQAAMMDEFCKLRMNSYYGKYGMNPRNYSNYQYLDMEDGEPNKEKRQCATCNGNGATSDGTRCVVCLGSGNVEIAYALSGGCGKLRIWKIKADSTTGYQNVLTAASITAAARAMLFRALCDAEEPLYCDTDSITAKKFPEGLMDRPEKIGGIVTPQLGLWKQEASGHKIAIAARKIYAIWGERSTSEEENASRRKTWGDDTVVKLASKGARLKAAEVLAVANGFSVKWKSEAPTFDFRLRRNGVVQTYSDAQNYLEREIGRNVPANVAPFPDALTRRDLTGGLERID